MIDSKLKIISDLSPAQPLEMAADKSKITSFFSPVTNKSSTRKNQTGVWLSYIYFSHSSYLGYHNIIVSPNNLSSIFLPPLCFPLFSIF